MGRPLGSVALLLGKRRLKVRGIARDDRADVKVQGLRADGVPGRAATLRVKAGARC